MRRVLGCVSLDSQSTLWMWGIPDRVGDDGGFRSGTRCGGSPIESGMTEASGQAADVGDPRSSRG